MLFRSWHAVVATWNDPDEALDELAFMPIVQRAIWVLAHPAPAAEAKAAKP